MAVQDTHWYAFLRAQHHRVCDKQAVVMDNIIRSLLQNPPAFSDMLCRPANRRQYAGLCARSLDFREIRAGRIPVERKIHMNQAVVKPPEIVHRPACDVETRSPGRSVSTLRPLRFTDGVCVRADRAIPSHPFYYKRSLRPISSRNASVY